MEESTSGELESLKKELRGKQKVLWVYQADVDKWTKKKKTIQTRLDKAEKAYVTSVEAHEQLSEEIRQLNEKITFLEESGKNKLTDSLMSQKLKPYAISVTPVLTPVSNLRELQRSKLTDVDVLFVALDHGEFEYVLYDNITDPGLVSGDIVIFSESRPDHLWMGDRIEDKDWYFETHKDAFFSPLQFVASLNLAFESQVNPTVMLAIESMHASRESVEKLSSSKDFSLAAIQLGESFIDELLLDEQGKLIWKSLNAKIKQQKKVYQEAREQRLPKDMEQRMIESKLGIAPAEQEAFKDILHLMETYILNEEHLKRLSELALSWSLWDEEARREKKGTEEDADVEFALFSEQTKVYVLWLSSLPEYKGYVDYNEYQDILKSIQGKVKELEEWDRNPEGLRRERGPKALDNLKLEVKTIATTLARIPGKARDIATIYRLHDIVQTQQVSKLLMLVGGAHIRTLKALIKKTTGSKWKTHESRGRNLPDFYIDLLKFTNRRRTPSSMKLPSPVDFYGNESFAKEKHEEEEEGELLF